MKRHLTAIMSAVVLLLAISINSFAEEIPRFEPSNCPIEVPTDLLVECGKLIVPENYDRPADGLIRLPFIIIHSPNSNAAPDPILYTEGGPGYTSLNSVWWLAYSDFIQDRDIVILEQRGNRYAQPSLSCDIAMWLEEQPGKTACLDSLTAAGIDVTNYTTANSVQDINSLRQALDYETWNLFGSSYSTRLMLPTMQQYPEGIRSVWLNGVSSPTETRFEHDPEHTAQALSVMFADCAADPACAAAYPDLQARFYKLVSQLNAEPIPVTVSRARDGSPVEPYTEEVNGHTLIEWMVVDSFYKPTNPNYATSYMPLLIDQIEKGNSELLVPWVQNFPPNIYIGSDFSWGLYFALNCQDDAFAISAADMEAQAAAYPELDGYLRHTRELEICQAWGMPPAEPILAEALDSEIPTLILSGAYDPITAPEWGRAAAADLSNGRFYEFPAWGHNILDDNPCAHKMARAFFADPTQAPDTSCMDDLPPPTFVLPQDVVINPYIFKIYYGETSQMQTEELIGFAALIILMAAFLILLVAGGVWLLYKRSHNHPLNRHVLYTALITLGVALAYCAFAFGMDAVLTAAAATTPLMLRFGWPANYQALLLLPQVGAFLSIVLLLMTVWLWLRGDGSLLTRLFFTTTVIAAVIVTIVFAQWQLIL